MDNMQTMPQDPDQIRETVKDAYGRAARRGESAGEQPGDVADSAREQSERIGYAADQLDSVPSDANLGLGCGNPGALAAIREGEVVVDLGSGAGLDALLAARQVGEEGRVIGIDMTPDMLARSRKNAVEAGVAARVEFREGIIEQLPVVSESVDVVISNCVINLSPNKPQVFREAFRILKSGGRVAVSDILVSEPLPDDIAALASAYVACLSGSLVADDYLAAMRDAGFVEIAFDRVPASSMIEGALADPMVKAAADAIGAERVERVARTVFSYKIRATKP
jgi:arsenite methyltransferase